MSIPSFIESPRFPDDIAYGAVGGPSFSNDKVVVQSGYEKVNINWLDPLCEYNFSNNLKTDDQKNIIRNLFYNTLGGAVGFRFKDWSDFECDISEGVANEDELLNGLPYFQLYKKYNYGSYNTYRKIVKPITSISIFLGGSPVAYTVDYTTGKVSVPLSSTKTITGISKASNGVATCVAHGFTTGDKIYFDTILGMTQVSDRVFTITVTGVDTFTIGENTTNYTTFISGTAKKYLQTGVITWSGEFDIPVRFTDDKININIETFNAYSINSSVKEIRL